MGRHMESRIQVKQATVSRLHRESRLDGSRT